jgi:hypothetical protein
MNRIILIGNGFDLAHNLKTSYKDFIDSFWKDKIENMLSKAKSKENYGDDFVLFTFSNKSYRNDREISEADGIMTYKEFIDWLKSDGNGKGSDDKIYSLTLKNKFLNRITENRDLQNWVDIEDEYYQTMLDCKNRKEDIKKLNEDFDMIKQLLQSYLTEQEKVKCSKISNIDLIINEQFDYNDFPSRIKKKLAEELYNLKDAKGDKLQFDFIDYKALNKTSSFPHETEDREVNLILKNIEEIKYLLTPESILFLNFNYTKTEKLYAKSENKTIHIHGKLNDTDNPIIFGYGDELSDEYKEIENLNNNDYLENVKSIKYSETGNYKQLLDYMQSEYYQVFIFGHSCGISDRTLLNTIFEHENCVSIQPFFYVADDGKDDYSEKVKNISRNFNDKRVMRDKVVNKTLCKPLK